MPKLRQPIKRHGGKNYLAKWIISRFPRHTHYVEPYFGGGSVLLQKSDEWIEGHSEVVNDLDGDLSNFWEVLRSEKGLEYLQRALQATSLEEEAFYRHSRYGGETDRGDVDRAVDFFIVNRQSRQGLGKDFATLSRTRTRKGMNEQVSAWLTSIDGLPEVHNRLKRVVIYNKSAIDVIRQQDGEETLFYLDPPYLHETRQTTADYAHEMSYEDHVDLLQVLADINGKFILSGYPSDLYSKIAKLAEWRLETRKIDNKASSKKTKDTKLECIWMNY